MTDGKLARAQRQPPFNAPQGGHDEYDVWTQVDRWALQRLHPNTSPYYKAIDDAMQLSKDRGLPDIEVSPLQGKFLVTQCQLIDAKRVLEVGTLGGTSSIWMALSGPDVKVTTIEIDAKHKAVADEAIAHADLSDRIEVLLGPGVEVLPRLRAEVKNGTRPPFDLTFIDADKQNNTNYFNEAIRMSRSRACIIVDNVIRRGRLADDEAAKEDDRVAGARKVVEAAGNDEKLMGHTLIQTVGEKNYDGFLLTVVK